VIAFEEAKRTAEVPKERKRASVIFILKRGQRGALGISPSRSQDM